MNRFLINACFALLLITTAHAQSVGIGTAQPDASAALEIKSSNKGLLIPRVDMVLGQPVSPAAGLLVFNNNPQFYQGVGFYYNNGSSSAPSWVQLVSQPNNFIRNQTIVQPNSNFHISGNGAIDGSLTVGDNYSLYYPLTVSSTNSNSTGFILNNKSSNVSWVMRVGGTGSVIPGGFSIANLNGGAPAVLATKGKVGINIITEPTATLEVGGDIKAQGYFLMDMKTFRNDYVIEGNSRKTASIGCPAGYRLISGGGGHRDWNSALQDIELAYNGPDPIETNTTWRIMAQNTSGSSRTMVIFCTCAKVK